MHNRQCLCGLRLSEKGKVEEIIEENAQRTNNEENDITRIAIIRQQVINQCLRCRVNYFLFPPL